MMNVPIPEYPEVNRGILLVKPTDVFFTYLKSKGFNETDALQPEDWEPTIYLVPEMDSPLEEDEWIKSNYKSLFSHLLAQTPLDEKDYPPINDFPLFESWFNCEFIIGIFDMVKGPLGRG
jgi:hypothetical protein